MKLPSRTVADQAAQLNFEKLEATVGIAAATAFPTDDLYEGRRFEYAHGGDGLWSFTYMPSLDSTYPWHLNGGSEWVQEVLTSQATSSTTFVDLATVGPTITPGPAGIYQIGFAAQSMNGTADRSSIVGLSINAAVGTDDLLVSHSAFVDAANTPARTLERAVGAGQVVKLQYRSGTTGGTSTFLRRVLWLKPIRVAG